MKYNVIFEEKSTILEQISCEVEADSEEEIKELIEIGDYNFLDSWEIETYDTEFKKINSIELIN